MVVRVVRIVVGAERVAEPKGLALGTYHSTVHGTEENYAGGARVDAFRAPGKTYHSRLPSSPALCLSGFMGTDAAVD